MKQINVSLLHIISEAVNHFNTANNPNKNIIEKVDYFFMGLNKLWNIESEESDNKSFQALLNNNLTEETKNLILNSAELKNFVCFRPMIMNHNILRNNDYIPNNINNKLIKESQEDHRKLVKTYESYVTMQSSVLMAKLLERLATCLYVVRSNIAHGEKTPNGPDLQKIIRDKNVCSVVFPLLNLLIEILFDSPSKRLVTYGTLTPDGSNKFILSDLKGKWIEGKVQGIIENINGLKYFKWVVGSNYIKVKILETDLLISKFEEIDRFEGITYRRILIPVLLENDIRISYIYSQNILKN